MHLERFATGFGPDAVGMHVGMSALSRNYFQNWLGPMGGIFRSDLPNAFGKTWSHVCTYIHDMHTGIQLPTYTCLSVCPSLSLSFSLSLSLFFSLFLSVSLSLSLIIYLPTY